MIGTSKKVIKAAPAVFIGLTLPQARVRPLSDTIFLLDLVCDTRKRS
jgi:hypothetical protein